MATMAQDLYTTQTTTSAAALAHAAMDHPHELVRVAAAHAALSVTTEPAKPYQILVDGTRSDDELVRDLAATALARYRPEDPALRRLTIEPETPSEGTAYTSTLIHGTFAANMAVAESDLLIAVGVRFDDRVTGKLATFAPHAKVIHIDIDPANVGKNRAPELSMIADAREALAALYEEAESRGALEVEQSIQRRSQWWAQLRSWQREQPLRFSGSRDHIKPQHVIRELHRLTNGAAIIATDVGQHQMWAAQFYPCNRARQWITSGGLGAMGFGVPAAIGAQLAFRDQLVVAVVGDGGFQMTNQELSTAVQYDLPVKIVIMNNGYLGMVRQWQEMFYERAYSEVDLSVAPDFVKLAEAYGAFGVRANRPDELSSVLEAGLAHKGVAVIDVVVSKEENVFPIVPAGANARDMMFQSEGV